MSSIVVFKISASINIFSTRHQNFILKRQLHVCLHGYGHLTSQGFLICIVTQNNLRLLCQIFSLLKIALTYYAKFELNQNCMINQQNMCSLIKLWKHWGIIWWSGKSTCRLLNSMNGQRILGSRVDQIPSASVDELLCVECYLVVN